MTPDHALPRVSRLSVQLANQIAAGEVVERPASVAKELIENSLDAGARRIDVHVEQGGRRLIRVRDDGCGIHRDDLALAVSRHATSKVRTLDDLVNVASLGFRGEALPSIASVSRLTLSSRAHAADQAWRLHGSGGEATDPEPVGQSEGTVVEVRDLFYNTPARRKFLRTDKTEFGHIQAAVEHLALSRFDVAFELQHNGRIVHTLQPAHDFPARDRRVAAVCGKAFMEHALRVDFEATGLRMWGWIAQPSFARSSSVLQYFFVNGRAVRDRLVNHAVRQAYADTLFHGQHPAYVLFLELDPSLVDVNVHPAKHEVRFRDSRLVHDFLSHSLHRGLQGATDESEARVEVAARAERPPGEAARISDALAAYAVLGAASDANRHAGHDTGAPGGASVLGPLGGRYLLARRGDGLLLVDIPAADAALVLDRLTRGLREGNVQSMPLLIPASIAADGAQGQAVEAVGEDLRRLGLEIGPAGPATVMLRQVPAVLRDVDGAALAAEVLEAIATAPGAAVSDEWLLALAARMARHARGYRGRDLSGDELTELLQRLEESGAVSDPTVCRVLQHADIERLFRGQG